MCLLYEFFLNSIFFIERVCYSNIRDATNDVTIKNINEQDVQ